MAVYIVTYDLNAPGKDYAPLLSAIRKYTHSKCLKSAFFIETTQTAAEVRDNLIKLVDSNDQLYVIRMQKAWAATKKDASTDWLLDPARNF
jgi:hypothetical protein